MQRKSSILNSSFRQKRSGFAMIMAIFFMIVMATLMMSMLESTTETANRTTNDYLQEQAQLLAKSAVEVAILRVSGRDRVADGCLTTFPLKYPATGPTLFDITVDISYFGFRSIGTLDSCTNLLPHGVNGAGVIQTAESNGTMMIDVYVQNNATGLQLSEPISYHRRTLQKL